MGGKKREIIAWGVRRREERKRKEGKEKREKRREICMDKCLLLSPWISS